MIHSMTGFGRARFEVDAWTFEVEVRSVNHRHLDARIRLPRPLAPLRARGRARGSSALRARQGRPQRRGSGQRAAGGAARGRPRGGARISAARPRRSPSATAFPERSTSQALLSLARRRALRRARARAEGCAPRACFAALEAASPRSRRCARAEGAALERDLERRLERVAALADEIAGARGARCRRRPASGCASARASSRPRPACSTKARLHQEIVLAADRLDVTEELVRLRSHLDAVPRAARGRRRRRSPSAAASTSCSRSSRARPTRSARRPATRRSRTGWSS